MADVAKHPWLTRRGSVYYLRAPVPKDIRDTFGKTEVVFSLRTSDFKEASRLIHCKARDVAEEFEACRLRCVASPSQALPQPSLLDPLTLQRLCDRHYRRVIDQDFAWRAAVLDTVRADPEGFVEDKYIKHPTSDWYHTFFEDFTLEEALTICFKEEVKLRLTALEHALLIGDRVKGESAADEAIAALNITLTAADRLVVLRRLMETESDALRAILDKDRTRYEAIVSRLQPSAAPPLAAPDVAGRKAVDPGPNLEDLVDDFLKEGERAGLATKSTQGDQADLREFVQIVGNRPIRSYTKQHGTKFKDTLIATPAQRKVKPFAGLTIDKAAQLADKSDPQRKSIQRLHVTTINDKLMAVRKFFVWANDHLSDVPNPIDGLRINIKKRRGKKSARRYQLRPEELQKLFNGTIFRGCKSMRSWKEPGNLIPRESARFWAPLIALYTGMRMGEIIQLRVDDIKTDKGGIPYFAITTLIEDEDDENEKSLKNANSEREIPIHPMLYECGLQGLLELRRKNGDTRLLMDYDRSPTDGSWSKTFSAWFRHYRQHLGVERIIGGRNRVDFHSFRHLFEHIVRNLPDVKQEFRDALQGHGESGVSQVYGEGVALRHLYEAVKKVDFPELDLSHLKMPATMPTAQRRTPVTLSDRRKGVLDMPLEMSAHSEVKQQGPRS